MKDLNFKPVLILILIFAMDVASDVSAHVWEESALKLRGESEQRTQAVRELNQISDLQNRLQLAIGGPQEDLALDVIRTLHLSPFFPRIMERIEKDSGAKLKWNIVATAAAIAPREDFQKIAKTLTLKLKDKSLNPPTLMAILSGLFSAGSAPSESTLMVLMDHSSYEVRIASVQSAVRLLTNSTSDTKSLERVFKKALTIRPYQARLLAFQALKSDRRIVQGLSGEIKRACSNEENNHVKAVCREIQ